MVVPPTANSTSLATTGHRPSWYRYWHGGARVKAGMEELGLHSSGCSPSHLWWLLKCHYRHPLWAPFRRCWSAVAGAHFKRHSCVIQASLLVLVSEAASAIQTPLLVLVSTFEGAIFRYSRSAISDVVLGLQWWAAASMMLTLLENRSGVVMVPRMMWLQATRSH